MDNPHLTNDDMFSTVSTERLHEVVVRQIESLIISKQLSAGDAIPPERRLAELLGVSRSVIREAMRILERAGLLEIRPGKGAFVRNPSSLTVSRPLSFLVRMRQGTVEDCLEFRRYLEPEIAYLAATRGSAEHIASMRQSLLAMEEAKYVPERFIEHDQAFHSVLAESTGNPVFLLVLDSTIDLLHEMRQKTMHISTPFAQDRQEHAEIFACVSNHDAAGARAAMIGHLQSVEKQLQISDALSAAGGIHDLAAL